MRLLNLIVYLALTACAAPSSSATHIAYDRVESQVLEAAPRSRARSLPHPEVTALSVPRRPVTLDGFALDLGVGEAPYDDGPKAFDRLRNGRAGFSDALIRVSYEHALGGGAFLVGSASAFRVQDQQIFRALEDLNMSWAVIGIRISF